MGMADYERLARLEFEEAEAAKKAKEEAEKQKQAELAAAMSSFYGGEDEDLGAGAKKLRRRAPVEDAAPIIEINKDKEEMAARMAKLKEEKMKRMAEEREAELAFETKTAKMKELMEMKQKMKSTGESE